MRALLFSYFLLFLFLFAYGCEFYEMDDFEEEYFIEAYLVAHQPFHQLRISTTVPFDAEYDIRGSALSDAEVIIFELDEDGNRATAFSLYEHSAGIYVPEEGFITRPRYTYELQAIARGRDTIRAQTTIPDTFRVAEVIRDRVTYQSDDQVIVHVTPSWYPGRRDIYIFSTRALAHKDYPMTPHYETDNEYERQARTQVRSSIITQNNYEMTEDGNVRIVYPWKAIPWFGPNRATIYAIDDNLFDYYRSYEVQFGADNPNPGQIDNIISHVEGGRGLFGAMAGVSIEIYVE